MPRQRPTAPSRRSTPDRAFADLEAQVDLGPRPSGSAARRGQAELLAQRLEEAGVEDVTVGEPLRNVVGILPGTEPGYVVLGAHHDTKSGIPGFVGANDGASGVAVVLELARSLPRPFPGPSLAIALFDGEEARGEREFSVDGKRGSTAYVETREPRRRAARSRRWRRSGPRWCSSTWSATATSASRSSPTPTSASTSAFAEADPEVFDGPHLPDRRRPRAVPGGRRPGARPDRLRRTGPGPRPARTGTRPRTPSTRSAPRASARSARRLELALPEIGSGP